MSGRRQPTRIMQVHTRYRIRGGEDAVVDAEARLMQRAGLSVSQVIFDNDKLDDTGSVTDRARVAANAVWSDVSARRIRRAVRTFRPDVVHIHNTFAAASPSAFWAASDAGVPVVHTLHNYRLSCPAATFFRDGATCTDCYRKFFPWPGILHSCVRHSRRQSAVAAATIAFHHAARTYPTKVDRLIALTGFQREMLAGATGLAPEVIDVIPNFVESDGVQRPRARNGVLYLGRLSQEKGVRALIDAARILPASIRVAGDGPLLEAVLVAAESASLEYLGRLAARELDDQLRASIALVVPSLWYEGFPMVVAEAYAAGTPVIASRIGSLAEIVKDGETGILVEPGDPARLAGAIQWAIDHPDEMRSMGSAAHEEYARRYTGEAHLAALMATYGRAIADHAAD